MTINANDTSSPPVTPTPSGPTPALTVYEQLVVNLNAAIDALVAQIPEFQVAHPSNTKFVRSHQNVPLEFSAAAAAAVNDSPQLQATNTLDVNQAREALQFISAFQPLYDKVKLLSQNLKFTIMERRAQVTVKAQMVYGVSKQFVRDPESEIAGHVKVMQSHLARGKRKSTKSPAPAPGTVTAPVTTTAPAPVAAKPATVQEEVAVSKQ